MVDTPVLEAGAERRESSSLSWGTKSKSMFLCEEKHAFFFKGHLFLDIIFDLSADIFNVFLNDLQACFENRVIAIALYFDGLGCPRVKTL